MRKWRRFGYEDGNETGDAIPVGGCSIEDVLSAQNSIPDA